MNTVLRVGVLLLLSLALFGSGWYIVSRWRTTFGLQRPWLLRVLVMAALVGWFMLMLPATKSADVVAGLSYVLGGYLFAGYVFLTLAFVLLHVIERDTRYLRVLIKQQVGERGLRSLNLRRQYRLLPDVGIQEQIEVRER